MPHENYPKYSRTVCVTDNGKTIKFVKVVKNSIMCCPNCNPAASGFTISLSTMKAIDHIKREWVVDVLITGDELWAMEGYDHARLPRSEPIFPLVSMDDPDILHFLMR
jgi:hypothetical protein